MSSASVNTENMPTVIEHDSRSLPWTRLIRFVAFETGAVHYGEPADGTIDIGSAYEKFRLGEEIEPIKARELLIGTSVQSLVDADYNCLGRMLSVKQLLSPLDSSLIKTAMCMGFNYANHAKESDEPIPISEHPNYFHKPATCVSDPSGQIVVPRIAHNAFTDYEGEIVAIIGRTAKNVLAADARSYLLGYTLANDVSARTIQLSVSQATFGKSFDTFMPLGPVIVNARALAAESEFLLNTELNGKNVQSASSRDMISSIPELVEKLSKGTTLAPGTLILTGTPEGIGYRRDPRLWLKHGDAVVVKGSNGLGSLYSHVFYEA